MAKKQVEEIQESSESAAALVLIKAKVQINTSVHGNAKAGETLKVSSALAKQLVELGDAEFAKED